eukprot:jgi/Chlat1/2553/Chrsp175S02407
MIRIERGDLACLLPLAHAIERANAAPLPTPPTPTCNANTTHTNPTHSLHVAPPPLPPATDSERVVQQYLDDTRFERDGSGLKVAACLRAWLSPNLEQARLADGYEFYVDRLPYPAVFFWLRRPGEDASVNNNNNNNDANDNNTNAVSCYFYAIHCDAAASAFADEIFRSLHLSIGALEDRHVELLRQGAGTEVMVYPSDRLTLRGASVLAGPLPESGFALGPLREEDADLVAHHCPYGNDPTYPRHLIKALPSVGVRCSNDGKYDFCQPLVAWALTYPHGALGMVHTLEEYRRNGLAKAAVVALAEAQLASSMTPYVWVDVNNNASRQMFLQLGFVQDGLCHWVDSRPKKEPAWS